MSTSLKIVIPVRNAEEFITRSINSVISQIYDNWQAAVIDDNSSDKTYKKIRKVIANQPKNKFLLGRNLRREYALASVVHGIRKLNCTNEDVILLLDGDDWLADENVFNYIDKVYTNNDIWLTNGTFVKYPSDAADDINQQVTRGYDYRKGRWMFSHLHTFKYFLWKNIREEDLIHGSTKDYYRRAYDQAIMRPMAQMAGYQKIRFIEKILYVYNTTPSRLFDETGKLELETAGKCLQFMLYRRKWVYKRMSKTQLLANNEFKKFVVH